MHLDHRGPSPLRPPPFGGMASYHVDPMSPVDNEFHPVIHAGAVAVITGAASGIGRAAAEELAKFVYLVIGQTFKNFCSNFCICYSSFVTLPFWRRRLGLKIALADVNEAQLKTAGNDISTIVGDANVLVVPTDVSNPEEVIRLRDKVYEVWGEVRIHSAPYSKLSLHYMFHVASLILL